MGSGGGGRFSLFQYFVYESFPELISSVWYSCCYVFDPFTAVSQCVETLSI